MLDTLNFTLWAIRTKTRGLERLIHIPRMSRNSGSNDNNNNNNNGVEIQILTSSQ